MWCTLSSSDLLNHQFICYYIERFSYMFSVPKKLPFYPYYIWSRLVSSIGWIHEPHCVETICRKFAQELREIKNTTPATIYCQETECPVCLESFDSNDMFKIPWACKTCKHVFCTHCFDTLMKQNRHRTKFPCPLCRTDCAYPYLVKHTNFEYGYRWNPIEKINEDDQILDVETSRFEGRNLRRRITAQNKFIDSFWDIDIPSSLLMDTLSWTLQNFSSCELDTFSSICHFFQNSDTDWPYFASKIDLLCLAEDWVFCKTQPAA